jgi:hypothetical protein
MTTTEPRPAASDSRRLAREQKTLVAMMRIFCRGHHGTRGTLCAACQELQAYALGRLDRCPHGADKPNCVDCSIHCYKPAMREQVREVMRYAGPRMLLRHPILAFFHLWDRRAPDL